MTALVGSQPIDYHISCFSSHGTHVGSNPLEHLSPIRVDYPAQFTECTCDNQLFYIPSQSLQSMFCDSHRLLSFPCHTGDLHRPIFSPQVWAYGGQCLSFLPCRDTYLWLPTHTHLVSRDSGVSSWQCVWHHLTSSYSNKHIHNVTLHKMNVNIMIQL